MNASINVKRNSSAFFTFMFVFLILPFFSIAGIIDNISETQHQIWQVVSMILMGLLALSVASDIRFKWPVGLFIAFQGIILFSCCFHHGPQYGIITVTVAAIILFMLMQSPYFEDIINAVCIIVITSVVINFVTIVLRLGEDNAVFFIGGKNALSTFLIPGAFLVVINTYLREKKFSVGYRISIFLCFVSVFVAKSATGIVVTAVALIFLVLTKQVKIKKNMYLFVIAFAYIMPLLFLDNLIDSEFWYEFTAMLGKETTLTSRTIIWEEAKELIRDNWILGAGRGVKISFIGLWNDVQSMYESHNLILEIFVEGGILAFSVFVLIILKIFQGLNIQEKKSRIIFVALCTSLVNGLTESTINNTFVIIILAVACRFAEEDERAEKLNEK